MAGDGEDDAIDRDDGARITIRSPESTRAIGPDPVVPRNGPMDPRASDRPDMARWMES